MGRTEEWVIAQGIGTSMNGQDSAFGNEAYEARRVSVVLRQHQHSGKQAQAQWWGHGYSVSQGPARRPSMLDTVIPYLGI